MRDAPRVQKLEDEMDRLFLHIAASSWFEDKGKLPSQRMTWHPNGP
jgi:hypothetical protein